MIALRVSEAVSCTTERQFIFLFVSVCAGPFFSPPLPLSLLFLNLISLSCTGTTAHEQHCQCWLFNLDNSDAWFMFECLCSKTEETDEVSKTGNS